MTKKINSRIGDGQRLRLLIGLPKAMMHRHNTKLRLYFGVILIIALMAFVTACSQDAEEKSSYRKLDDIPDADQSDQEITEMAVDAIRRNLQEFHEGHMLGSATYDRGDCLIVTEILPQDRTVFWQDEAISVEVFYELFSSEYCSIQIHPYLNGEPVPDCDLSKPVYSRAGEAETVFVWFTFRAPAVIDQIRIQMISGSDLLVDLFVDLEARWESRDNSV